MKITKRFFSIFMCLILIICITGVFPEKPSAAAGTVKATKITLSQPECRRIYPLTLE